MPESTLSLSRTDFGAKVAYLLGYGRGADFGGTAFSTRQQQNLDDALNNGLHGFYYPVCLPGERTAHEWSFLRPTASLTLELGLAALPFPADFGGMAGDEVVIATPTGRGYSTVPVVGVAMIDRLAAENPGRTGSPMMVAKRPLKGTGTNTGQRWELAVYPTADVEYVLQIAYTIVPNALTAANPYPYGGPVHSMTLLESCLSVAEANQDDTLGLHKALFMERLQASVSHDRKFRPRHLGYMGDGPRDDEDWRYGLRQWPTVTLAGQAPE